MHHWEQEWAHSCSQWCIVGCVIGELWDLWIRSIVSHWVIVVSDNGLVPTRHEAIAWINAELYCTELVTELWYWNIYVMLTNFVNVHHDLWRNVWVFLNIVILILKCEPFMKYTSHPIYVNYLIGDIVKVSKIIVELKKNLHRYWN